MEAEECERGAVNPPTLHQDMQTELGSNGSLETVFLRNPEDDRTKLLAKLVLHG